MNEDFQNFVAYVGVSDTLIEQATKEEIAKVARVLALHVAHYRQRYGDVSIEESLEMLRTERVRHVPIFVSDKFRGKSGAGLYGDVVMELDWSVGQVLEALRRNGIDQQTLVVFTSDNGP